MRKPFTAPAYHPLTDAEYTALLPHLAAKGRPPADRRRTLDAIFWVACSRQPWRALPPELGNPNSAYRQLLRWARSGVLKKLLVAVSNEPGGDPALASLRWRVGRAFRRMARRVGLANLELARDIGMFHALPCEPIYIPNRSLSETALAWSKEILESRTVDLRDLRDCMRLHKTAIGAPRRYRLY